MQHVSSSRPSGCDFQRCRQFPKGHVLGGHAISTSMLFGHSGLTTSPFFFRWSVFLLSSETTVLDGPNSYRLAKVLSVQLQKLTSIFANSVHPITNKRWYQGYIWLLNAKDVVYRGFVWRRSKVVTYSMWSIGFDHITLWSYIIRKPKIYWLRRRYSNRPGSMQRKPKVMPKKQCRICRGQLNRWVLKHLW